MDRLILEDMIKALKCTSSQDTEGDCYKDYENFKHMEDDKYKRIVCGTCYEDGELYWLKDVAELLEELKSYKDIGTPKELKELKENGAFTGVELAKLAIMQKELKKYKDSEEQGLFVRFPCKVGDDIYVIPSQSVYEINIINGFEKLNRVYHQHIGSITFFDSRWYATSREEYGIYNEKVLNDIAYGITWFTDHEEAEKKLEEFRN